MGSRLLRALVLLGYVLSVAAPSLAVPPADKAGADELLRKGDQYVLEGKLGPARTAYEKAIAAGAELTGDYARARNLGMIYMNGAPRDFKKAARWLELAWKLNPAADDTRLALAQALSWSGKYDAAIEHYRVLVKKSPDTPDYSSGLANTLYWAGKPDEAFGVYDRYLERRPTHVAMRLEYARVLSYARRLPEATAQYNTVLQADPNNVQAQVGLAKIDSWQDDFKSSLDRYNKVLKKYPNLYDAVVGKAYTLYWMGRTQEAAALFQQALKRNPNDKEVQATLKEMGMAGEKKPAVAAAQPATEPAPGEQKPAVPVEQAVLQPETFATHQKPAARNAISVMMEQAQAAANANNYVEAVHLYHEVLAKEPNNTQAMIQIARVLSWSRNFEESAKEYDQLLQLEPDNAQARLERARVLSWGQNYDASIEEYRSLIKQAELAQAQQPKPVEQPKPFEVVKAPEPKPVEQPKPVEVVKSPEPKPVEQPKPVETVKAPEPKPVEQPKPVETVAIPETKPMEPSKPVEVVKAPEPKPVEQPKPVETVAVPETKPVEQPKPVEVAQAPAPEPVERVAPEEQAAPPAPAIDLTQTRLELARVLAWSKRYDESLAQFNQILPPEQKPEVKDKPILIEKARVLSYARNYDEAIKTYDVALALDPADIEARLGKGQTLYWWGRLDQAASVLRPLMQVQALSPESKTTTAFTLAAVEHGRGKESAALSLLDTAGDNSDVKLLRTNIQEGLRPVLRFTFGWENDQEAPGGGSLAPTTVTRALRYSTALSFNVKPDLRMTVSNTVTRATTSNPLLGKHGSDALAIETEAKLDFRVNSWLRMLVGLGEGSLGDGFGCDLQTVPLSTCAYSGERTHHLVFDVRPSIARGPWRLDFDLGRHIADWTPLSIHDSVLRTRFGVAASYNWRDRLLTGAEFWHSRYNIESPQLDPALMQNDFAVDADGVTLYMTPTWYRGEHVRIEGGVRYEWFSFDESALRLQSPAPVGADSGGFFAPHEYQRVAGTGRIVFEQSRFRMDVHGTFGPQRVQGFAALSPPPPEWGTTGSFGAEISGNFGRFRPFLAYEWFDTATAAGPGQSSGSYRSHSIVGGFTFRF